MQRFHQRPVPQGSLTSEAPIADSKIVSLQELGALLQRYREWQGVLDREAEETVGQARALGMPDSFIAHIMGAIQDARLRIYSLKNEVTLSALKPDALHAAFTRGKPVLYVNALDFLHTAHDVLLHEHSRPQANEAEAPRQAQKELEESLDESYDYNEDVESRLEDNMLHHLNPVSGALSALEEVLSPL